ncbi:ABC transporter permease [Feifania hominis]|uniref:Transport permease protein n=1 Tax=Feifania hominis TaxID=2763660 RepID=A0A926DC39_9FIRM|nr:ABC transporter permease [Feifania hominis]MBC8535823.1 ABC transporter permease [Feifania hominis]
MKSVVFAARTQRELLRDPLSLSFALGFPLVVLLLLTAIQANIPVSLFELDQLAPGIAVFGLSFVALFSGLLIAKDRTSSFLTRLFVSPMRPVDFILGYTLPLVPLSLAQSAVCLAAALALGLRATARLLLVLVTLLPTAVLFIAIGLLCGSLLSDKQVGGVCGALLTNLSAWLSGIWFDLSLVGGAFETIAYLLPFAHAVDASRAALCGDYAAIMPHLWWVIGYAAALFTIAVAVFRRKMTGDKG